MVAPSEQRPGLEEFSFPGEADMYFHFTVQLIVCSMTSQNVIQTHFWGLKSYTDSDPGGWGWSQGPAFLITPVDVDADGLWTTG